MRTAHHRAAALSAVALVVASGCETDRAPTSVADDAAFAITAAKPMSSAVQFGSAADDRAHGVALDRLGVAVAGVTAGSLPGGTNAGGSDAFVRLYTAAGVLSWSRQFGTSADDAAYGVAQDRSAIYVGGTTSGSLGPDHLGENDGFVQKLDAAGNVLWTSRVASYGADSVFGVAVDRDAVYVAGEMHGRLNANTGQADADGFVARLDAVTGEVRWVLYLAGALAGDDQARDVAVDKSGVYVAATLYGGQLGLGPGLKDATILKLNPATGAIVWYTDVATAGDDVGWDVAVQREAAYLVGTRGSDGFAAAVDLQTGAVRWVTSLATTGTDVATTVVADRSRVLVGGATSGAFPGSTNGGLDDAFVASLDAVTGGIGAVEQFGTGASDIPFGSAFDGKSVFLAGMTGATLFSASQGGTDAWWASTTGP